MLPKGYGLLKVHKRDVPLRIVISTINNPCDRLATIIYKELNLCIKKPESHIDNSFALINKLKDVVLPSDYILLSLDFTSLFTNITLEVVLNSLERRIRHIRNTSKIQFGNIIEIVHFLFDNQYFKFGENIFKQIKAMFMCSPSSPLFADMVMEDCEIECLNI